MKSAYILTTEYSYTGDTNTWLTELQKQHYQDSVLIAANIIVIVTEDHPLNIVVNFFELHEETSLKYFIGKIGRDFEATLSKEQEEAIDFIFSKIEK